MIDWTINDASMRALILNMLRAKANDLALEVQRAENEAATALWPSGRREFDACAAYHRRGMDHCAQAIALIEAASMPASGEEPK